LAEVKLGMLATQKGGPEVKELGQKMVDDHTAINKDLAGVADTLGVMLPKKPGKDQQAEYDKLNGLSGDAFDKEYIFFMAKAHREDLHAFRTEASVAVDPALQSEVVKASMVILHHLQMVTKLAADKGVTLPPRPPRPAAATPPAGH
jgi:putative membrane protein